MLSKARPGTIRKPPVRKALVAGGWRRVAGMQDLEQRMGAAPAYHIGITRAYAPFLFPLGFFLSSSAPRADALATAALILAAKPARPILHILEPPDSCRTRKIGTIQAGDEKRA